MTAREGRPAEGVYCFMETDKQNKLQFRIDIVLTVLFIVMIFFFPITTAIFKDGLIGRAFYMRYISQYLEDSDDYTPFELVEAAIHSWDNFISTNLYGTETLGKISSTFQYALGKKLVSSGNTQMIRLNTGHLYDLQSEMSMESARDDILSMRAIVPEDTPFLFVYEHPTIYDYDAQMPKGYEFLDFSRQEADEIVGMLREAGVDVMDSRDVLPATGLPLEDYLMYTDQHWATSAAILMAQAISEHAEEVTGVDMPTERLDLDQFETTVYPKLFMGKYGQRVGTLVVDPDDIVTYKPKYDTNIHFQSSRKTIVTDVEGPFDEVALRREVLEPEPGKSWNMRAYMDYGLTEEYDVLTNEDGADCTILLLKDSYSAPIGRFLSLVADEVYSVDMRQYAVGTLDDWVKKYDPDIVVVAYSLQMLRDEMYEFE